MKKLVLTILWSLLSLSFLTAATITSTQPGDWHTPSTWNCACVPSALDDVIIEHAITVNSDGVAQSLVFGESFSGTLGVGTVQVSSSSRLTVSVGDVPFNRPGNALTVDNGSTFVLTTGDLLTNGPAVIDVEGQLTIADGDLLFVGGSDGTLTVGSTGVVSVSDALIFGHSNRTITIEGSLTTGSLDATLGDDITWNIATGGTLTVLTNLQIGTSQDFNINGTLNVSDFDVLGGDPVITFGANSTMAVTNDFNLASSAVLNMPETTSEMSVGGNANFEGAAESTIQGSLMIGGSLFVESAANLIAGTGTVRASGADCPLDDCGEVGTEPVIVGLLPVELTYFRALQQRGKVQFDWETATELNNDFFTIGLSFDGVQYETLAVIDGNGTTDQATQYQYDAALRLSSTAYFRLTQTDFDGTWEHISLVAVNGRATDGYAVSPNFGAVGATLQIQGPKIDAWALINQNGQTVLKGNTPFLSLPSAGRYILQIQGPSGAERHKLLAY